MGPPRCGPGKLLVELDNYIICWCLSVREPCWVGSERGIHTKSPDCLIAAAVGEPVNMKVLYNETRAARASAGHWRRAAVLPVVVATLALAGQTPAAVAAESVLYVDRSNS